MGFLDIRTFDVLTANCCYEEVARNLNLLYHEIV